MSEKFLSVCVEQGIKNVIFVRHANANPITGQSRGDAPHDWKFRDQTRGLTSKGKDQCEANRHIFTDLKVKANLTSPARRASDTAVLLTMDPKGGDIFLRMVESLHPAGMSTICEDLFDTMGYGPLKKFFDADKGKEAFLTYAESVCGELAAKAGGPAVSSIDEGDTFALFGHAVFLNAVVYAVSHQLGVELLDDILTVDLGEAEAIVLNLESKTFKHLK
jgi:hypothetical protein